jgi:hypothetical protein
MVDCPDAAAAAIAAKALAGQAATVAETTALAQAWVKRDAVAALQDYWAQVAALAARADRANSF